MSIQVFLQGKIVGIDGFLQSAASLPSSPTGDLRALRLTAGRSRWVALLSEVLPRALLAELGLARILLGSSGGGQFLVVLPMESLGGAESLLESAGRQISEWSGGRLRLIYSYTENLGEWPVVRRRLTEGMQRRRWAPLSAPGPETFAPFEAESAGAEEGYFRQELAVALQGASEVGWSPDEPARVTLGGGKHCWPLAGTPAQDAIVIARHAATCEETAEPAGLETLARRAQGAGWGMLRGDVDNFGIRLRRVQTIEEHVQLSVMYKQFFAGELEVVCSLPEYWRKVSVLYSGGDDFAVYGSWDALIPLAREMQRLFHRFTEENLKDFPGAEGKTITMAIAIARDPAATIASVYAEAGSLLEETKSAGKDCIHVLGQTLEWRQLAAASDLRETVLRLAAALDSPQQFLTDLAALYRKAAGAGRPGAAPDTHLEKPWQVQRRLNRALGDTRDKELQKRKTHLTNEILAKGTARGKLRPGVRVALEWARLLAEV